MQLKRILEVACRTPYGNQWLSKKKFLEIPFITRDQIGGSSHDLLTKHFDTIKHIERRTSGTSGKPISVYLDKREYYLAAGGHYVRCLEDHSLHLGSSPHRTIIFFLNYYDLRKAFFYPFSEHIRINFSSPEAILKADCNAIYRRVSANGPSLLFGYPADLLLLAKLVARENINLPLTFIYTTGQYLHEEAKKFTERVFKCPVVSYYGNQETGPIAFACLSQRDIFHLAAERIILEIIDSNGNILPQGVSGEIVLTCLDLHLMPIIRYRTGDLGKIVSCPCGSPLPAIQFTGRTLDIIYLPNGRAVPERRIHTIFLGDAYIGRIRQFQIHQAAIDAVKIKLTPLQGTWTNQETKSLRATISSLLPGVSVEVVMVESITEEGAKVRSFIPLDTH